MKYFNAPFTFFLIILFVPHITIAQEEETEEREMVNESEEFRHFISLSFGYTYVPGGGRS